MSQPVRILLLEVPKLLRGILENAIQRNGDCEVTQDSRPTLQVLKEGGAHPDIVVIGLRAAEDAPLVSALLARWPLAHVVAVTDGGEEAVVYELEPHTQTLHQPSPEEIVDRLRDAVGRRRVPPQASGSGHT